MPALRPSLLLIWTGLLQIFLPGQAGSSLDDFLRQRSVDPFYVRNFYLAGRLENILDQQFPTLSSGIESAGRIGIPDPLTVSWAGANPGWNHFTLDGFPIGDPFRSGSTLSRAPLLDRRLEMDPVRRILGFSVETTNRGEMYGEYTVGTLGGILDGANQVWLDLAHHPGPMGRLVLPPEARRKPVGQGSFYLTTALPGAGGPGTNLDRLTVSLDAGVRQFLDFGPNGFTHTFHENWGRGEVLLHSERKTPDRVREGLLVTGSWRDRDGAEFHYASNETRTVTTGSLSWYRTATSSQDTTTIGFTAGLENRMANGGAFTRNLFDVDGEAFSPQAPDGLGVALHGTFIGEHRIPVRGLDRLAVTLHLENGWQGFSPTRDSAVQGLLLQNPSNRFSVEAVVWQYRPLGIWTMRDRLTLALEKRWGHLNLWAEGGVAFSGAGGDLSPLLNVGLEGQAGLRLKTPQWLDLGATVSFVREPVPFEVARAASPSWQSGSAYGWDDSNRNGIVESEELGTLTRRTGAAVWRTEGNLGATHVLGLDLPWIIRPFRPFAISLTGTARVFQNLPWLRFDGGAGAYGTSNFLGGEWIWIRTNAETRYVLGPFPSGLMPDPNFPDPFYAGATLRLTWRDEHFLADAAFTALMVPGLGALGNGPLANVPGAIDESQANPNTWKHTPGRMDSDRGYIGRLLLAWRPTSRFRMAYEMKYKDGQPFHFYQAMAVSNGLRQAVIWNYSTAGDNIWTGEFGNREDGHWNAELRAAVSIDLGQGRDLEWSAGVYNLLDVGAEIGEIAFGDFSLNHRTALELQVPRGLWMKIGMTW